jgi:DNA-binding CsgD family transcriptional regulator
MIDLALPPDGLSELIGHVYEGPLEAMPWGSSLQWLTANLPCSWAVLVLRPASQRTPSLMIHAHGDQVTVCDSDFASYERYSQDPFTDLPLDRVLTPEEFLGAARWYRHPFFRQHLLPNDIHYELGADFLTAQSSCRLRVCRAVEAGPYSKADRALLQALVPHFKRSVELQARLRLTEAERTVLAGSLDHLGVGTVILDELGEVLTASDAAHTLLTARQWTVRPRCALWTPDRISQGQLQGQIQRALAARRTDPFVRGMTLTATGEAASLRVLIKSIAHPAAIDAQRRPAVALFLRDSHQQLEPRVQVLQMLFGLTPAEARFAQLIAAGTSLERAGRQLGITRNTCKSRLQSIFVKTGARRQAALVGVLRDTLVWL